MQWKRDEDLTIKMLKEAVPLDVRSKMPLEILGTLAVQKLLSYIYVSYVYIYIIFIYHFPTLIYI